MLEVRNLASARHARGRHQHDKIGRGGKHRAERIDRIARSVDHHRVTAARLIERAPDAFRVRGPMASLRLAARLQDHEAGLGLGDQCLLEPGAIAGDIEEAEAVAANHAARQLAPPEIRIDQQYARPSRCGGEAEIERHIRARARLAGAQEKDRRRGIRSGGAQHVAQAVDAGREVRIRRIEQRCHDGGAVTPGADPREQPRPQASRPRLVRQAGDFRKDRETACGFEIASRVDAVVGPVAREPEPRTGRRSERKRQREHDEGARPPGALVRHIRFGQDAHVGGVDALLLAGLARTR